MQDVNSMQKKNSQNLELFLKSCNFLTAFSLILLLSTFNKLLAAKIASFLLEKIQASGGIEKILEFLPFIYIGIILWCGVNVVTTWPDKSNANKRILLPGIISIILGIVSIINYSFGQFFDIENIIIYRSISYGLPFVIIVIIIYNILESKSSKKLFRSITYSAIVFISIQLMFWFTLGSWELLDSTHADKLITESLLEMTKDNTKAIRLVEAASIIQDKKNFSSITHQTINEIVCTTTNTPFYTGIIDSRKKINSIKFSYNGTKILTVSDYINARVWDLNGKKQSRDLSCAGENPTIISAQFCPIKDSILIISGDNKLNMFDSDFKMIPIHSFSTEVIAAKYADSGHLLVATTSGEIYVIDPDEKKNKLDKPFDAQLMGADISKNGKYILLYSAKQISILKMVGSEISCTWINPKHRISKAAFNGAGKIMAYSQTAGINIWDVRGKEAGNIKLKNKKIEKVIASTDGVIHVLARDKSKKVSVSVWSSTGVYKKTLFSDQNLPINNIIFSPDGSKIFTWSKGAEGTLWNSHTMKKICYIKSKIEIKYADFSRDNKYLVTASNYKAKIWDLQLLTPLEIVEPTINNTDGIFFNLSPDEKTLILGIPYKSAKLYSLNGELLDTAFNNIQNAYKAEFSKDGKNILTYSSLGEITLWNAKGQCPEKFKNRYNIPIAKFLPDSKHIVIACGNKEKKDAFHIEIVDLDDQLVSISPDYNGIFQSLDISSNQELIVATTSVQRAIVWEFKDKKITELETLSGEKKVKKALFSHSKNPPSILTTHHSSSYAKLWNLTGEKPIRVFPHKNGIHLACFSPEATLILTQSVDCNPIIWKRNGKQLFALNINNTPLENVTFSPDGQKILTVSSEGAAQLWKSSNGELIANFSREGEQILFANFLVKNGLQIITVSSIGSVKIWHTPDSTLKYLKKSNLPLLSREEIKKFGINVDLLYYKEKIYEDS